METGTTALLGPALGGVISGAFRRMEIAEQELARRQTATPFLALMPPALLGDLGDHLYRHHARELVERDGAELGLATSAEMCAALCQLTLRGPVNHATAWIYWRYFERIFPGKMPEPYADDYDKGELGEEIERRCAAACARERERGSM